MPRKLTAERVADARELLTALAPEDWVARYGKDLLEDWMWTEDNREAMSESVIRGNHFGHLALMSIKAGMALNAAATKFANRQISRKVFIRELTTATGAQSVHNQLFTVASTARSSEEFVRRGRELLGANAFPSPTASPTSSDELRPRLVPEDGT